MRCFKRQIEEAEEIAALNLAKFRKTQVDLEEGEERFVIFFFKYMFIIFQTIIFIHFLKFFRADLSEQAYAKFKAMGRSRGATPLPNGANLI